VRVSDRRGLERASIYACVNHPQKPYLLSMLLVEALTEPLGVFRHLLSRETYQRLAHTTTDLIAARLLLRRAPIEMLSTAT